MSASCVGELEGARKRKNLKYKEKIRKSAKNSLMRMCKKKRAKSSLLRMSASGVGELVGARGMSYTHEFRDEVVSEEANA